MPRAVAALWAGMLALVARVTESSGLVPTRTGPVPSTRGVGRWTALIGLLLALSSWAFVARNAHAQAAATSAAPAVASTPPPAFGPPAPPEPRRDSEPPAVEDAPSEPARAAPEQPASPAAPEPPAPPPVAPAASAAPSVPLIGPPAPPPPPAPSASVAVGPGASVRLGDAAVFTLRVPHAGKAPDVRAREASAALKRALSAETTSDVLVSLRGGVALLSVGKTPIVELGEDDAKAAASSSLETHAAVTASAVREALLSERRRSDIAKTVFSSSLVVFLALIAFYLVRKLGEFAERAAEWLDARSDRELSLRFQNIEMVRPAVLRSSGALAISILKWLTQLGVAYTWLVVVLSLFDATRGYTQRLTGFVVAPLSQLMGRLATSLPLLVVALLAALAVFVLVRFVGLFFVSVARGETPLGWLPTDLAAPTSVLLRSAIVIAALIFLAPVVTGEQDGPLGRVGFVALVAFGLAATPILASAAVGAIALYGRRLRPGETVEFGAYRGRVVELTLLELRLLLTDRSELRIPHLLTLVRPLRVLGPRPRLTLDVYVSAGASVTEVRSLLATVASKVGSEPSVEIVSADADAVRFRVAATCESLEARTAFHIATLDALSTAGVTLGRDRS